MSQPRRSHQPPVAQAARFAPAGFFVMRTPLLPFDATEAWSNDLQARAALDDPAGLEAALAIDCAHLRARLRAVLDDAAVRDALFVASPNLDDSLRHWVEAAESERGQKVERALVRYFMRMAGRATPFGLFAGWAVGSVTDVTRLAVAARSAVQRHTRLDMDYLFALTDALGRDPELRPALRFVPNSSLYNAGGHLRYAEARVNGRMRTYHLVAVETSAELGATLERARAGATIAALATALVADDDEIAPDEATAFIDELVASQILVPDLAPAVTGNEPIHGLIAQLQAHPATAPIAQQLASVRAALAVIDTAGPGVAPERYRAAADLLAGLPTKVELARLFQVDTARPASNLTLGSDVTDEIARGVELLRRVAQPYTDALAGFRQAFVARYESREVPLVEALDDEIGIGFGSGSAAGADAAPLLGKLAFPASNTGVSTPWNARETLLLKLLQQAVQQGAQTIELTEEHLKMLEARAPLPLPHSFAVMAALAAPAPGHLAAGEAQIFIQGVSGPSGARLLGRFCHADGALHERVATLLRAEEALTPDAVFAEVVHLPEGRVGNVLCRPTLRDYEIPFLGHSGAPSERQIPISDLLVSVVDERIVLRSRRLGREVIPRLTSAHNYSYGLAPYRFLCALQSQGVAGGLSWNWGALASAPFLPRVQSGRLVLARAHWRIDAAELRALGATHDSARFLAVQEWRVQRQLPRRVLLEDADNELLVDFDNALSIESFVDLVKERRATTLVELFPAPEQLCAHGPDGRFVHELVVPFLQKADERRQTGDARCETGDERWEERRFPPGSAWLYAKIYTGTAVADQVLREVIAPVVAAATRSGAVDGWFFIRYADPEHHLRLRCHGQPTRLLTEVLPALHAAASPLLSDGRIWRVQLDTYEREVERYGGALGMELAEQFFHADSAAVRAIIEQYSGDAGTAQRWRLALCGLDLLLTDLELDVAARHALIRRARDNYAHEFRADANLTRQLGEKYRQQRKNLETLLHPAGATDAVLAPGLAALRARSDQLAPVVAALKQHERAGRLTLPLHDLALSYGHMHINRLLRSAQRRQEFVLYELLDRLYSARAARIYQM